MYWVGELLCLVFFFKQKTAYEMRISDWSSDVCSSDLGPAADSFHHFGAMRIAPSRRMTSPFSIGLRTMLSTSWAYSSGLPRRLGWGTCLPRLSCAACGSPASIGVQNIPGAMVMTRRSEEHTSELQSLMRHSYAVF